ncbi:hypothetical protein HJG44_22065 [Enterovirga sp. DB1703]|uniref:Uncharacterized protein n=1 Tax=Enterovirga aerilata TaxID=2730920 RepID=A0A849IFW4_9HYPH|nr:hypothetical protein [Enterovirga sp. DB1703]
MIVASGPSAAEAPLAEIEGRARIIATNNSWRLVPFADALYASDDHWWRTGAGNEFQGLKISRSEHPGVHQVELALDCRGLFVDGIVFDEPGVIGSGGGSGFQALNLAVQFGATRIALVGLDARVDRGVHWHGPHEGGLSNPHEGTAELWRVAMDRAAPVLAERGIEVVNCSACSALQGFRKMDLSEWLGG